jgi:hypothetical protein
VKPLTLEALQELIARETATVQFPGLDRSVTVRQLVADELTRVQAAVLQGKQEDDPEANHKADVLVASICITDANYDTDEGREALTKLPRAMVRKIADAVMGLSGADGTVAKN